jgi:hypothetical protein
MRSILIFILLYSLSQASNATSGDVPDTMFSLGSVEIGKTSLDEIEIKFGKTDKIRGKGEDSAVEICYKQIIRDKKLTVIFESGPMGGFKRVTGFRITEKPQKKACAATSIDLSMISTGNGASLFQDRDYFLKISPVSFKKKGSTLFCEINSIRNASKEELLKIKKIWPNERQAFFDVTVSIEAVFDKKHLIEYSVRKIETY